ncbi:MAG TPA: DUF899 family protein [Pyrinomonadaceae bacterium]|nr:DUF899 family protein [Pyrinomonadaceae bacterium]
MSCGQYLFAKTNLYRLLLNPSGERAKAARCIFFTRDTDGTLRHFYTAHPRMAEDIKERGLDLLIPVYNILDLTPEGRGDWYASFDYAPKVQTASR